MVFVARSDTLWDVFRSTGYIGAYLLYLETLEVEEEIPKRVCSYPPKGVAGI